MAYADNPGGAQQLVVTTEQKFFVAIKWKMSYLREAPEPAGQVHRLGSGGIGGGEQVLPHPFRDERHDRGHQPGDDVEGFVEGGQF